MKGTATVDLKELQAMENELSIKTRNLEQAESLILCISRLDVSNFHEIKHAIAQYEERKIR